MGNLPFTSSWICVQKNEIEVKERWNEIQETKSLRHQWKSQGNNCAMHLESICVELEQEVRIVSEECQEEIFVKAVKRKLCAGISEC